MIMMDQNKNNNNKKEDSIPTKFEINFFFGQCGVMDYLSRVLQISRRIFTFLSLAGNDDSLATVAYKHKTEY